jgi:hypothetical protein
VPDLNLPSHAGGNDEVVLEHHHLLQLVPQYEEVPNSDSRGQDPKELKFEKKILEQFRIECEQDIHAHLEQLDIKHVEYSGHLSKGHKEGKGHHYDKATGSLYYGSWSNGKQHGYGIKFFGKKS